LSSQLDGVANLTYDLVPLFTHQPRTHAPLSLKPVKPERTALRRVCLCFVLDLASSGAFLTS